MNVIKTIKDLPRLLPEYALDEPTEQALREYLSFLMGREDLLERAQYLHDEVFEKDPRNLAKFDTLEEQDGREEGMLFAVVYLARYEMLDKVFAQRGIPAECKAGALFVYKSQLRKSQEYYGKPGLHGGYKAGAVGYLTPWKYILGRLTFDMDYFAGPYAIYRNREDNSLTLMAVPNHYYQKNGRRQPKDFAGEAFEPTLEITETGIRGYAFGEDGNLDFNPVTLDAGKYECVLKPGDTSMSVHVPELGKLLPELVDDAFARAEEFFARYYPEWQYPAYVCSSWLLDKDLAQLLPQESNIMRFQSRFRIAMSLVHTSSLYWYVFGMQKSVPLTELKPQNAFQQKMLDFVKAGNILYSGNGFILRKR